MRTLFLFSILVCALGQVAHAKPIEWTAQKSIEFSSKQFVIDGEKTQTWKCASTTKSEFAKLKLGDQIFSLQCIDNHMGGLFIGDETLAQADGDEGDTWETQTLLFLSDKKTVLASIVGLTVRDPSFECEMFSDDAILKKNGWSAQKIKDCRAGKTLKLECTSRAETKKWDATTKSFTKTEGSASQPKRKLTLNKASCS